MTHCSPTVGGDHVFVVPARNVIKGKKLVRICDVGRKCEWVEVWNLGATKKQARWTCFIPDGQLVDLVVPIDEEMVHDLEKKQ